MRTYSEIFSIRILRGNRNEALPAQRHTQTPASGATLPRRTFRSPTVPTRPIFFLSRANFRWV